MRWSLRNAVLAAVAYADVFDSPLTVEEIQLWLVFPPTMRVRLEKNVTPAYVRRLRASLVICSTYVCLKRRAELVPLRVTRLQNSKIKWRKVERFCSILRLIPTIQMVGVTGSLAMDNTNADDDIDLFFVVDNGTIWLSRLLVVLFADFLGARRTVTSKDVANKFCLNMFVTVNGMKIPRKDQNLYTAHEVLQMKPVLIRNNMYRLFLERNSWSKRFLPNAYTSRVHDKSVFTSVTVQSIQNIWFSGLLQRLNQLAEWVQKSYMRSRRTTEIITADALQFHPRDAKFWVKVALRKRYNALGLPLDKVFFDR